MQGGIKPQHLPSRIPPALLSSSSSRAAAGAGAWIYRRATENATRRLICLGAETASDITGNEGLRRVGGGDLVRRKITSGIFERTRTIYVMQKTKVIRGFGL